VIRFAQALRRSIRSLRDVFLSRDLQRVLQESAMYWLSKRNHAWVVLLTIVFASGCAGNGEELDQNGRPATPGSAGTGLTADFNSIQDNVFTPVCTQCHAGATAPRGLRLDAGNSYALLVGVASSQVPSVQRVQPGNPAASYLIQKLLGTAAVGQRMPLGGPFLSQSTIDVISEWIRNGAPRPAAFTGVQKSELGTEMGLQVVTTSPLDASVNDAPVSQIVIAFDRELDVSRIDSSTVVLESSGQIVRARLNVPLANPTVLLLTPLEALDRGEYRVTLRGSGGSALAGLDAHVLNANANDNTGSDSTIAFAVAVPEATNGAQR
jgi:hypothetical protein